MTRFWSRLTALALALALLTGSAAAESSGFSDVPERHWASGSVRWCREYGLMQGVSEGVFGLGQSMTRAAYVLALCRLMGWEMISPEKGSYADNQNTRKWYYSAVETAYAHGALTGESSLFRPDDAVTREEMAKMTVRALGFAMLSGAAADDCPFSDVSVARGYVALAYRMGLIRGVSSYGFDPKATATREQAAAVLLRAYDRLHASVSTSTVPYAPEGCVAAESITDTDGSVPVSPRAPLESVYDAACAAGEGGSVALYVVPLKQTVRAGKVTQTQELTQTELSALLSDSRMRTHRSEQHQSSCAYRVEEDGSVITVWYESAADLAVKTTLCRLLGVGAVCIVDQSAA